MSGDRLIIEGEQNGKPLQVIEKASLKEVYLDGVHGVMVNNGSVKLNLFSNGYPAEGSSVERREVDARLVCNIETFLSVVDFLSGVAADIRKGSQDNNNQEG